MKFPTLLPIPLLGLLLLPLAAKEPAIPPKLDYQVKVLAQPRPIRAHVVKLDLLTSAVVLKTVIAADPDGAGPAEAALTDPFKLAEGPAVLGFININPWQGMPDANGKRDSRWRVGQPVDILGLARSAEVSRSPGDENPAAAVAFGADGKAHFGPLPPDLKISEGISGFSQVVTAGKALESGDKSIHPRSAIGANKEGTAVWLVVVDGRQKGFSEGMNLDELGKLMAELGCWNAVNLDGGGSSVLGLMTPAGKLETVNSPSDRRGPLVRIRPVPCILTIQSKPE